MAKKHRVTDQKQKPQIDVTDARAKYRCLPGVQQLIDAVNEMDQTLDKDWKDIDYSSPWDAHANQEFCKIIHQMAQFASLPVDWRDDYSKAVVGAQEEWDRFCQDLSVCLGFSVKLWRKWRNERDREWRWPLGTYELTINSKGKIKLRYHNNLPALDDVEANRIRECRHCQKIFWAQREDKWTCDSRCSNNLRQRTFREKRGVSKRRK